MSSADGSLNRLGKSAKHNSKSCQYSWRLFATGLSFVIFGIGTLLLGIVFLFVSLVPFEQSTKQRYFRRVMHNSAKTYINIMGKLGLLTFTVTPLSGITTSGLIVTANHPTLLDAIFIIAMCENLCCMTKKTLWTNPFTSFAVRMAGYICNDAGDFIEQATGRLNEGENLLIFPEGTRSADDSQLNFKRGAANLAVLAKTDIMPVVIQCRPRTLQKNDKWYHIPKTVPHFAITTLPVLRTAEHIQQQAPRTIQYRQLSHALKRIYQTSLGQDNMPQCGLNP